MLAMYFRVNASKNVAEGFSFLSCPRNSFMKFFLNRLSGGERTDMAFLIHATAICSLLGVNFNVWPSIFTLKPL